MPILIKDLFQDVYKKAQEIQELEQTGTVVDGRAIWQDIEKKVEHINIIELKYNLELNLIYDKMEFLFDKYHMKENELNPKSNHFFMQLKNLVKTKSNFEIKLNRVLQLAFNAGQLSIFIKNNKLDKEIVDFVMENKLLDLTTYISLENQKIINEKYLVEFEKVIKGGYYQKYIKYKEKYINLKNKLNL